MKKFKLLILLILAGNQIYAQPPDHSKLVVGYYAQWSIYARDYNVLDIEGDKLTHIMYAFFDATYDSSTDEAKIESLDEYADFQHNESGEHSWDDETKGNIGDLKILKEQYPHLKILISIGGWTRSQNLPAIAESSNARLTFAQSMVDFMNLYPWIDGFDVDWEFPLTGGTDGTEKIGGVTIPAQPHTDNDHKNFVYLLRDMKEVFNANGMQEKEISISMGNNVMNAANQFIGPGNEATFGMTTNIVDYCDFVSFFGYDFGGNWNDKTCYNAPLFGGDNVNDPLHNPTGRNQVLGQLIDVYMNEVGIPADKLVMGLPFYGKIFEGVASTGAVAGSPGLYESAPRDGSICEVPQAPQGSWDNVTCENSGSIEFCDLVQGTATNVHQYLDTNNPSNVSTAAAA
ncbi:MAG: glycosyl hydrolase family 18 protein, partial [Flavobacteriales bacterium]|nr:glycosyl hydrolase family 18 protein [Flavobacteriales bacterium]